MTSFINSVDIELANLTRLEEELVRDETVPKMNVITVKCQHDKRYYYHVTKVNGKRKQKYLGDAKSKKLHALARASYKKELLRVVRNNIKVINRMLDGLEQYDRSNILANLSPCLHIVPFDTDFDVVMRELKEWAADEYDKNPKPFSDGVILAKDGTRVRSRAECIIYNDLFDADIPFRYDPSMKFRIKVGPKEYEEVLESPDFQIQCPDGSMVLIEHAGLLTKKQYADDLFDKLTLYMLNGFTLGYTLFAISEDVDGGIDSQRIDKVIRLIRAKFPFL